VKFNRERVTAFLALLLLVLGIYEVARGVVNPAKGIAVPDTTLTRSSREVIPRRYRTFVEEGEPSRNPFSFSEGWQRMETAPMAHPVLPPVPRPVPLLGPGPSALDAGFVWQDRPPPEIAGDNE
jgi:hypothetical protein